MSSDFWDALRLRAVCDAGLLRERIACTSLLGLLLAGAVLGGGCTRDGTHQEAAFSAAGSSSVVPAAPSALLSAGLPVPARGTVRDKTAQEASLARPLERGLRFTEVHEPAALDFVYDNGHSRARLMIESTGGGGGWLDYDDDGWLDAYLTQGGNLFSKDEPPRPANDQLFRNWEGRFQRVTEQAGISDQEFGHGVAVGDFDDDGFDDLYISNVGPDKLYRNQGDGTFQDVTLAAGIDNPLWASSAAWADLDGDYDLDLYVCNYVDYDPRNPISCLSKAGVPGICHPEEVDAVPNKCYFNQGDGIFRNLADERGLNAPFGKSLGVVIADLNGDALPDVYVANDTTANHLFLNRGNGFFEEQAVVMGCAMSGMGHYQASMGIAFGDFDENGYPDLYCTHFTKDSNTLYANFGPAGFEDVTRQTDLHLPTLSYLGFGSVMMDFDFNGKQDLFIANGHIDDWRERSGDAWYMQAQLFTFDGTRWHDCGSEAGPYFQREWLGRAVALGDYDRDDDPDLLVVHQNDPVGLLRNDSDKGHYLGIRFRGFESNRRGIGAQVIVEQDQRRLVQQLAGGTSYCASHEPALWFGLGNNPAACRVTVIWPSGKRQILADVPVDRMQVLDERQAEAPQ